MEDGDAADSGADDDDADAAALRVAQTGKAGTITDREAEDLRNGTPLGRHTQDACELAHRYGRQSAQFADAHGVTGADPARAPDDDAANALLVHFNGDRNKAIKQLRAKQKQHLQPAYGATHAADERAQTALESAACGASLTRALLGPADGDLSLDGTMRGLFAAVDEGPIPDEVVQRFGFPTACVYGPLAKIGYGNIYDSRSGILSSRTLQVFHSNPPSSSWARG